MLGRLLDGRYKIVKGLGSGGFGHTYIAEDTKRPGNPVCVLKHLSFTTPDPSILKQARRMFFAEAETLEKLGRHDQIPQLLAYFEEDHEFYLVQEFVQGHPLSDELVAGQKRSEDWVIDCLEDVLKTLEFVHRHGVIHRDLKPDNLIRRDREQKLVLIDFGAVKSIETSITESQSETAPSLPVYTSGYASSEQCLGKPHITSDLYSLGMIAIQALTGVRPAQLPHDSKTYELLWRNQASVREELAIVIETMTKFHFANRYQSAAQVLEALAHVKEESLLTQAPLSLIDEHRFFAPSNISANIQDSSPNKPSQSTKLKIAAIGAGAIAVLGASAWALSRQSDSPQPVLPQIATPLSSDQNKISYGERVLGVGVGANLPLKQEAADQVAAGNFDVAIAALKKARAVDRSDPETLIYLNNAAIATEKAYTIAVAVPLKTQPQPANELLRGVAQAQERVNTSGGINGTKLKVAIASDDNNPDTAQRVAKTLVNTPAVLGVVGHGISDTTFAAGEVYQAGELVAIAPISSATELSRLSHYVFRAMPSDKRPAKRLADYMVNQLKKRKVAIFYNSTSQYSTSLKNAFKDALFFGNQGSTAEIDFNAPDFEQTAAVDLAIRKGAEVLMLVPDNKYVDRALLVIAANQKRLPMLAGDVMFSPRILRSGDASTGLTIAVPYYQLEVDNSLFQKQATKLWNNAVNWRTVLAYDATQALITAIGQSPTRNGIRSILAKPDFVSPGGIHPFSFSTEGDRETKIALMKVTPARTKAKAKQYEFQPVK
ncbi:MAG: ABC transporter substrate-binding protein [Myxacorys chilensis ATA2-1-KO14]|jgi:ABC-type branched-subunit amino acid transport system substrate-binding protein/serine/threonine protein kinase|nr:ABC transporter substrate-binding protein [Myxacorys chilensis ATA2-1-KO14]